jgi:hypothetical protein
MKRTAALRAESDQQPLEAAVQRAVAVHRHQDSSELRRQQRKMLGTGIRRA